MVRVRALGRGRAERGEVRDGVLAELNHVGPDRALHAVGAVLFHETDVVEAGIRRAPQVVDVGDVAVLVRTPRAECRLALRVIAVEQAAPQAEVPVLVADDPSHDGLGILVARADRIDPRRVLGARIRMLVVDDIRLPARRVIDAPGVIFRRMLRIPLVREPVGRPLVADQREDAEAALLARVDEVVVILPLELVVRVLLDVFPHHIDADRVRAHLHELVEVVVNLVEGLPNAERPIPCLVRNAVRNPRLARGGIEEVAVLHGDECVECKCRPRYRATRHGQEEKTGVPSSTGLMRAHIHLPNDTNPPQAQPRAGSFPWLWVFLAQPDA
ncbi:MAG: hypothetical protein BWY59_00528 [Verrucomicrobia bacterium ADurb.Bin345]|nr:MAG: hypothetical protein BWY59_00528 [Verrucomicrobia bacterium ADurb.Bin345]